MWIEYATPQVEISKTTTSFEVNMHWYWRVLMAQATDQRAGTHRFLLRDGAYYSYELSPYQTHSPGDHDRSQVTW
jgi:hypothetical protein